MKKTLLLTIFCLLSIFLIKAQSPEKFNYQGVLRSSGGDLIKNATITIQVGILEGSSSASASYIERHSAITNNYGQFSIMIGDGTPQSGSFSIIDWSNSPIYLSTEIDENGGTNFKELSTVQLLSVPYSLYSNKSESSVISDTAYVAKQLDGDVLYFPESDTLFAVKDHDGNVVFAVFPDGAMVYVNETAKGKIGGFAVSGRNPAKATEETFMVVTADSTRVYVNQPLEKGKIGGFAVSGRNPAKSNEEDYLVITADSTRIYVNKSESKGKIGGFAVSGRNPAKGSLNDYIVVTEDSTRVYVKESQVKGTSGGFAVEKIDELETNSSGKFMDITPLNSFIGLDAGKSNTTGERNAFIGYQAGMSNTTGNDNVFIGNEAGLNNIDGENNIFLGSESGKNNESGTYNVLIGPKAAESITSGKQNIVIGEQAGSSIETGWKNVFIGVLAGSSNIDGQDNVFVGNFAGWKSEESSNVYIGRTAGMYNSSGTGNVFIGEQSGRYNYEGSGNVFIGAGAGQFEAESNKLYISNTKTSTPLIYGEFDKSLVEVNGSMHITGLINLKPISSYPGEPEEGDIFYDSNTSTIKYFNGTDWMELTATTTSISPPGVTTDSIPALYILADSCLVYGNVTDQGGASIVECGVCYSETPFFDKTEASGCVTVTPGVGSFNTTVSGLYQNQDFYLRAFATNSEGTSMGKMIQITTPLGFRLPTVETSTVVNILQTTATGGGNVLLPGGVELTAMGICWSTSPEPTIEDNLTSESVAIGEFVSNITGLTSSTTYYVRAYATNANGTSYGDEVVFTTASDITTVTDADGNIYNTVQIGNQTWLKENLRATKYNDGSDITEVTVYDDWIALTSGAFCWYNNDSATYNDPYGVLYNYYAVIDSRSVCPTGWHVPTIDEWDELSNYLGGEDVAGGKLRETGTTHWLFDPGVDNSTGFTALGAGFRYPDHDFLDIGNATQWFTSVEEDETSVWTYYIRTSLLELGPYADVKTGGYSVRCIKD